MPRTYQVINNELMVTESFPDAVRAITAETYHRKISVLSNRIAKIENEISSLEAEKAESQSMLDELSIYMPDMPPAP